ncbi:MAG: hypothetical protein N3F09_09080 [Bacteroidia bacterium]|nr:hypothetical protein [Bacteroidia bacterium]
MPVNILCEKRIYDVKEEVVIWMPGNAFLPQHYFWVGINPDLWKEDKELHIRQIRFMLEKNQCLGIYLNAFFMEMHEIIHGKMLEEDVLALMVLLKSYGKLLFLYFTKNFSEYWKIFSKEKNNYVIIGAFDGNDEHFLELKNSKDIYFSFGPELLGTHERAQNALKNSPSSRLLFHTGHSDVSIKYIFKKSSLILGVDEDILKNKAEKNYRELLMSVQIKI